MNPEQFRQEFLQRMGSLSPFQQLLDLLPDVAFFMKDRSERFIMQNRRCYEICGAASELETVGKTDFDFFPRDRAEIYVEGDRRVMKSGVPIINEMAPAPAQAGSDQLIIYSKVAVHDQQGRVIGVAGMYREIGEMRTTPKSYGRMAQAVRHLHIQYGQSIRIRRLAAMVGISQNQFERRFRQLFGNTPRQYLQRVRVNAACRLLAETEQSVTEIALAVGFYDHSHFWRIFSRLMGISPLAYRKRHLME